MEFRVRQAMEVLERSPAVLRAMLSGLSDDWIMGRYGKDTFNPFDVVGHLLHCEKEDWIPRLRIVLTHRDREPFPPLDRYAMYETSKGKSIDELLDAFAAARRASLTVLTDLNLSDEQLDWCGQHPALGRVAIRQLLATWTAHDLNHIHQIAKAMAFQYRDAVGPWQAYLGVYTTNETKKD